MLVWAGFLCPNQEWSHYCCIYWTPPIKYFVSLIHNDNGFCMLNIFREEVALHLQIAVAFSTQLVGETLVQEWVRNFSLSEVFSTTLFSIVEKFLGLKAHSILTKVACTFWSNEWKQIECTAYQSNVIARSSIHPGYFGGFQHCQSPEQEHPLTAELLQQLHLELGLTRHCSQLEELPLGRESARFFLHTTWPHYRDHLQGCQLASAALCWTGICGSTQWEPHLRQPHGRLSSQPLAYGTAPLCSPPNAAAAASHLKDLYGKLWAECLLYF